MLPRRVVGAGVDDFVTIWKTDNPGTVDETGLNGTLTHDYGTAGTYIVRIYGVTPQILFNNLGNKDKILSINQWGTGVWVSIFNRCEHLRSGDFNGSEFNNSFDSGIKKKAIKLMR